MSLFYNLFVNNKYIYSRTLQKGLASELELQAFVNRFAPCNGDDQSQYKTWVSLGKGNGFKSLR